VLVLLGSGWLVTAGNLFARLPVTPLEGHGLDPKVRDFATLLESPLRIVAYATACTTAIGMIGPLLTMTRPKAGPNARWLLSSWLLLSVSLVVGLWHAYGTADARAVTDWGAARSLAALVWVILSILLWVTLRGRIRWLSPGSMSLFAGSVLLVTGLVGWSRGATTELRIKVGRMESVASLMGASYALTHMGVSRFETPDRFVSAATLDLKQDAKPAGLVTSERNQYFDLLGQPIGEPVTKVGVHRGVLEDLRVIYRESSSTEEALYRVELSPFAWLIWLGAGLLILGGLVLIPEVGS
jgi:cytochrome c biogenesis factor